MRIIRGRVVRPTGIRRIVVIIGRIPSTIIVRTVVPIPGIINRIPHGETGMVIRKCYMIIRWGIISVKLFHSNIRARRIFIFSGNVLVICRFCCLQLSVTPSQKWNQGDKNSRKKTLYPNAHG